MGQIHFQGDNGSGYDFRSSGRRTTPSPSIIPGQAPGDLDNMNEAAVGGQFEGTTPRKAIDNRVANRQNPDNDEIMVLLQKFYDEYNSPLDYNDPFVKSILDNAQASTTQRAGNAGVFGPYSQNLAQQAYIKGAAGLQSEKQRMAGQALGMLTDYKKDKRNFDYNKAKDSYQAATENWQMQQNKNQDLWKMVGGGLGAVGGGILGIAGGPAGIIAGATGGFGLGQQVGSAAYQGLSGGADSAPRWNGGGY